MKLREFLKKYSPINDTFIDEFYNIIKKSSRNRYAVNIDVITSWLSTDKNKLKKTLLKSYKNNKDYIIKKEIMTNGSGGHNRESIVLTVDCFKRLCLRSKTSKAEEVRTYFIQLESLVDKYKKYIVDGLNRRIKELEDNQKPKYNKKRGVIYIIRSSRELKDLYKIGKSIDFPQRIKSHNSSHADDLEIIYIFETNDIDGVENCLKGLLKKYQYRKKKEFYQVNKNLLKELISMCEELVTRITRKQRNSQRGKGYFLKIERTN